MSPENQIRLEILKSAPLNAWIALSADESRIVATGDDYGEVVRRADEAGEADAVILKTPPSWARFSVQNLNTIIPFRVFPDGQGSYAYWVVLNVQIAGSKPNSPRTKRFESLIDSGATRCLFHSDIGRHLGLDMRAGIREVTNGIGGQEEVWLHNVRLYIPGGPVDITAGFKEDLPVSGLLGMAGFFEHFKITFEGDSKQCSLERIYYS